MQIAPVLRMAFAVPPGSHVLITPIFLTATMLLAVTQDHGALCATQSLALVQKPVRRVNDWLHFGILGVEGVSEK